MRRGSRLRNPKLAFTIYNEWTCHREALLYFLIKMLPHRIYPVLLMLSLLPLSGVTAQASDQGEVVDIYVIPINDVIDKPNLYILRRGLKEAIKNDVAMVILDMDTPGGRVDVCLDMMKALGRFDGITATYINEDAISAGSFIAASTKEIYFAPFGKIGASAVIQGPGADLPETARQKIESYLRANIRARTDDSTPYRSDAIRAMLDPDFEFKIGEQVIKPEGELLTLTAKEAVQEYGDPPLKLLGEGVYESIEELLTAKFGKDHYRIRDFEITYSEQLAKWMNAFAPALLGFGFLLLILEFKVPGFGIFGIGGLLLIAIFFIAKYIAGLAGNESIVFFALGVTLVLVELIFFAGSIFFAASGLFLIMGALLWAMIDYWPGGKTDFSIGLLIEPLSNLIFGLSIALFGAILISKFFKGSWIERQFVLESAVGDLNSAKIDKGSLVGRVGVVITPLHPAGHIEIDEVRYTASCDVGAIEKRATVRVVHQGDFDLVVEEVKS